MQKPNARILIVEDEPLLQHLVRKQLNVLGHNSIELAANGKMAVQLVNSQNFQLIFMDVMMPEIDGFEATRLIREHEKVTGVRTRIVAMTGLAERARCLASGMDDFLQKPVLLEPLKGALTKWMQETANNPDAFSLESEAQKRDIKFAETDRKLDDMQHKIDDLRKRYGLES